MCFLHVKEWIATELDLGTRLLFATNIQVKIGNLKRLFNYHIVFGKVKRCHNKAAYKQDQQYFTVELTVPGSEGQSFGLFMFHLR